MSSTPPTFCFGLDTSPACFGLGTSSAGACARISELATSRYAGFPTVQPSTSRPPLGSDRDIGPANSLAALRATCRYWFGVKARPPARPREVFEIDQESMRYLAPAWLRSHPRSEPNSGLSDRLCQRRVIFGSMLYAIVATPGYHPDPLPTCYRFTRLTVRHPVGFIQGSLSYRGSVCFVVLVSTHALDALSESRGR